MSIDIKIRVAVKSDIPSPYIARVLRELIKQTSESIQTEHLARHREPQSGVAIQKEDMFQKP